MVRQGQKEVTSMKARRYELTDKEWELIWPLIPISHTGRPQKDILADKAYGTKEIRTYLHDQSARYTIPLKVNTKQPWPFDKETYKRRNVIERFFNRLKEFRRAETRYDKRDDSFLVFVMLAAICVAFSILHI